MLCRDQPAVETEVGYHSSVREAKRARQEPAQDLSGEIPILRDDETLTNSEILAVPPGVIPSSSIPVRISPGAASSSGVKRTYSESIALPNLPGVTSSNSVKRAHGESVVTDDEEQPGTRARISNLIAGLHGVDTAEDDEICNGDGSPDKWLSSWYPETHMSQKMVIEAKRKEMERFKRMKVYRVVTRESMKRDEEGKMLSIKWVITIEGTEEHQITMARLVAREFNTGDKRGELRCERDFWSDDETSGWRKKINHAGRCQDSLLVWRRQESLYFDSRVGYGNLSECVHATESHSGKGRRSE